MNILTELQDLKGYDLLHAGTLAMADIERNGMRLDVDYCHKQKQVLAQELESILEQISETETGKVWTDRFYPSANFGSGDQLATVLFENRGFKARAYTPTGKLSSAAGAFEHVNDRQWPCSSGTRNWRRCPVPICKISYGKK